MDQSSTNAQACTAPKSGFHQAASFVERALSFRTNAQRSSAPTSGPHEASSSAAATKPTIRSALSASDLKRIDSFPSVSDEQIRRLLPDDDLQDAREWVHAALQEMHLNFDLDPKLLGEHSDANRGNALLALLLSRIVVTASDSAGDADSREPGHLSGAVVDQEGRAAKGDASSEAVKSKSAGVVPPREYETHDLLKAIDKKDVETILAIRNANFDLLLDLSQGGSKAKTSAAAAQAGGSTNTPLGYAISLGKGWESVSIVLVGALSKFVNQLPDDEDEYENASGSSAIGAQVTKVKKPKKLQLDPRTMARLRKVRVNLKLAIDHSIFQDQTSLLASYLQVLVMSEGSPFLHSAIEDVAHCLSARSSAAALADGGADPVARARSQVMQFVTDSLRHKTDKVAAVKDYVANAQSDLLLMSLWSLVKLKGSQMEAAQKSVGSENELVDLGNPLPMYFFARDDRVASHFVARVTSLQHVTGDVAPTSLVKVAIRVAEALTQGARRKSSHERLQIIDAALNPTKPRTQ
ncbi:uncharacterized protein PAN0_001c0417 [Moesziomyces antarcticus]|uniref:Uncharacterized protein n=1 Tax=Pseudozyma antarctica TaxID=84753 RepID=A0A5C3FF38_PSEA2|nr:uncharacterized protein PAN0_001c0417 [Moesziomyces antarcticus]GAK62219.1 conserved hypothetical protein [Moesziomyces antarcticus]SPO42756.1 uncharacterized protein PSANT_00439 [Moesziomyces antarcticus]